MRASILHKAQQSAALSWRFFEDNAAELERCVRELGARFERRGRLFCMGNGGSACDAEHVAVEFAHPIVERRRALPAQTLGLGTAFLTAVGNDTDFVHAFASELELLARPEDALLGISSSGASASVNRALKRGRELGLLTLGFAGRDGGSMPALCDFCFVVPSWSTHRIQEVHTVLLHLLWDELHLHMGADDVL